MDPVGANVLLRRLDDSFRIENFKERTKGKVVTLIKDLKPAMIITGLLAVLLLSCGGDAGGRSQIKQKLVITGSSTIAPLMVEIGRRFEAENPGTRIDVQTGGSSRGVRDASQGLADIGMVSRALKPADGPLLPFIIAHDGIGLIVHQTNPVQELSREQVIAIYTGKITRWAEVGGPDLPITVVSKAEGRSTLELFLAYYGLENTQIRAQIIIGDNEQGIKTVAGNPGAIGYVSIGTAEYDIEQGVAIRLLPVEGVAATRENVSNQTFPLSRQLNLVTAEKPEGLAKTFIDFAQSDTVADIIEDLYFVPISK